MITNLHKIIKIEQIIWSLLPFAVVFLKLAYFFVCVQIVREQQYINFFFNFLKVYGLNLYYAWRYCCLEYIYIKKWILKILVITSFCRGRAEYIPNTHILFTALSCQESHANITSVQLFSCSICNICLSSTDTPRDQRVAFLFTRTQYLVLAWRATLTARYLPCSS